MGEDNTSIIDFISKALNDLNIYKKSLDRCTEIEKNFPKARSIGEQLGKKFNDLFEETKSKFPNDDLNSIKEIPPYNFVEPKLVPDTLYITKGEHNLDEIFVTLELSIQELENYLENKFSQEQRQESDDMTDRKKSNRIFIVHGHDNEIKQTVARILEKLDLKPIILHEQPDKGKTIIEKFFDYSDVDSAIILLSPDDVGYPKGKKEKKKFRARQNVILEMGFFLGKLGRKKVFVIHKEEEGFKMPSDYKGVLYIPYDANEGWKIKLAKELRACGYDLNLDKLL